MGRTPTPWRRKSCGGAWYAKIDGRHVRLADADATVREAARALGRALEAAASGVPAAEPGTATIRQAAATYLEARRADLEAGRLGDAGFRGLRDVLAVFVSAYGDKLLDDLRPTEVERWLADAAVGKGTPSGRPWGVNYRALAASHVRAFTRWAARSGLASRDVLDGLRRDPPRPRETVLTGEAADRLIAACEPDLADYLLALRLSGCRPNEVATLTADRVDLDAGTWHVVDKIRRKTGAEHRVVSLGDRGRELTRRRLEACGGSGLVFARADGTPWDRNRTRDVLKTIRKRLGLGPEATPYHFRHLFATDLLEAGVPIATVATLLGHKSTDMVQRVYSRLENRRDHLKDALKGM